MLKVEQRIVEIFDDLSIYSSKEMNYNARKSEIDYI